MKAGGGETGRRGRREGGGGGGGIQHQTERSSISLRSCLLNSQPLLRAMLSLTSAQVCVWCVCVCVMLSRPVEYNRLKLVKVKVVCGFEVRAHTH